MVEPIRNVGIPEKGALKVNVDVLETGCVHNTLNVIGLVSEDDLSSAWALIVTALTEGLNDCWGRITIDARLDNTDTLGNNNSRL